MIEVNIKLFSWIIVTLIFLVFNIFFNKSNGGIDIGPLLKGGISIILYLLFWVGWLLIF
jgi:hypothetical protein